MSAVVGNELDPRIVDAARAMEAQVAQVVLGKPAQVRLATAALLAGQHLLLDDLPGVGKTTLATALARVVGGSMGRVQGAPDLLPTDLTGSTIYDQRTGEWQYRAGPIQANVVLIDELNRITPRTQSALLEAMAEGHVTVDGVTRPTPVPFLVVATMNPIGSIGTFPLTTAQRDRFGLTVHLGPVERSIERRLLKGDGGRRYFDLVEPVFPVDLLPELQAIVAAVSVSDAVLDYALDLCDRVREDGYLSVRAPRSLLALARSLATLEGRCFVVPDDVRALAVPTLAHRLAADGEPVDAHAPGVRSAVEAIPVPEASVRRGPAS